MNKAFKKISAMIIAFGMMLNMGMLVSCNGDSSGDDSASNVESATSSTGGNQSETSSSDEKPVEKVTVTFNYNYEGAPTAETVEIDKGALVEEPETPSRTGYTFGGWYTDVEGTVIFNFSSVVTEDTEVYAHWISADAVTYAVVFDMNYSGSPAATSIIVEDGNKVSEPTAPSKAVVISSDDEKYSYTFASATFVGWYTDKNGENKYDFNAEVSENLTLYAKWSDTKYTFEAELTDLTGKTGFGYSISWNDEGLIRYDSEERNQSASFGYSVGYLYNEDLSVDYKIYSDKAVENVKLEARLSAEFRDIYIAPQQTTLGDDTYYGFQFLVNEYSLDYSPIALTGAKAQMEKNQRPFDDWVISTTVSLKEGWNDIVLLVTNSVAFESTVNAVAPMVDCIYLTTSDATLSWNPKWSNLEKVHMEND